MDKTLQEQYNLIKEGKGSKEHFMRTVRHTFPDLITPTLSYNDTVTVLKNKSILSESIGGLVTTGRKQDWHDIFKENMANLKEDNEDKLNQAKKYYLSNPNYLELKDVAARFGVSLEDLTAFLSKSQDKAKSGDSTQAALQGIGLFEAKEAKAEEKETTKDVTDMATRGYDYKDTKNYDNVFGQEFLKGFYTEMQDSKNEGKTVDELRAIVAKNLAKDISHYVKDGQFGIKGVGYTTEAPGLGTPKEAKGKHKSSGYGDLKESVLRLAIQDIIKEVLTELTGDEAMEVNKNSIVHYKKDGKEVSSKYISQSLNAGEPLPVFKLENGDEVYAGDVIKLSEALDKDSIKEEGESAKKEAMKKRITNEMLVRKKKIKALQTLTELDEEINEENAKKLKELQSEIKQLEGMAAKLDGKKKVKEGTKTFVAASGSDEEQAVQQDPTVKDKQGAVKALKNAKPGDSVVVATK